MVQGQGLQDEICLLQTTGVWWEPQMEEYGWRATGMVSLEAESGRSLPVTAISIVMGPTQTTWASWLTLQGLSFSLI